MARDPTITQNVDPGMTEAGTKPTRWDGSCDWSGTEPEHQAARQAEPRTEPQQDPSHSTVTAPWPDSFVPPCFDETDGEDQRALNLRLRRFPRFRLRGQWEADLIQALLRGSQLLAALNRRRFRVAAEDRVVAWRGHRVRVRIIRPPGPCRGVHLDIHGGAWAVGNARMNDPVNAAIARDCGLATVSVDYRLFGRNSLDAVFDDCEAAARWVLEDGARELAGELTGGVTVPAEAPSAGMEAPAMFLGGDSAGAHLAATVLLRLRDAGLAGKVRGAVLFYGAYDLGGSASLLAAPPDTLVLHHRAAEGLPRLLPGLSAEARRDARYSPLFASLEGMPPALFLVGERDPLLDDSLDMARRWQEAGSHATLLRVPEAPHAFNRFPGRVARKTNAAVRAWLAAGAGNAETMAGAGHARSANDTEEARPPAGTGNGGLPAHIR